MHGGRTRGWRRWRPFSRTPMSAFSRAKMSSHNNIMHTTTTHVDTAHPDPVDLSPPPKVEHRQCDDARALVAVSGLAVDVSGGVLSRADHQDVGLLRRRRRRVGGGGGHDIFISMCLLEGAL